MKYIHYALMTLVFALGGFSPRVFSKALSPTSLSAFREPSKSYKDYLSTEPLFKTPEWRTSVEGQARAYSEKDFGQYLEGQQDFAEHPWMELQKSYQWVRDLRFLTTSNQPDFKRRISWLYPDDGCFTRAELTVRKLQERGFTGLKKIFVFGDLMVNTPNTKNGRVTWWFHVAPLVKTKEAYYVIDPATSPKEILTIEQWLSLMHVSLADAQIAVCAQEAYDPGSHCEVESALPNQEVLGHQSTYLRREWRRMVELDRDPQVVLGERPPWTESQP